jgi:putative hydrolase of the HAD superfamily
MASIEVVLFDFGGVIAPLANDDTVGRLESSLGLNPGMLHTHMYEGDLWPQLSVGRLTEDQYWRELGGLIGHDPAMLQQTLTPIWDPQAIDQGVIALARSLRDRVRLAILSNATLRLESHLQALGIDDLFDPVINSARIGLRKPDEDVFQYALKQLGTPAGSVLFIDDKERNTVVAEALGIPSIRFDSAEQLREALTVYGLLARSDSRLVT